MKRLQITLLFIYICINAVAQQAYTTESINIKNGKPTDWTVYMNQEDFKIEYRFSDCDPPSGLDNESILFKFTNNTPGNIVMSWHLHLSYDEICRTCDFPEEYGYELILGPNEVIEGDCLADGEYRLKIFSKFIDPVYSKGAQLTDFKLANFTVSNN